MTGMHTIFVMYAPIIGVCFVCAVLIRDEGVAEKDAKVTVDPSGRADEVKNGGKREVRDVSEGVVTGNVLPVGRQEQV